MAQSTFRAYLLSKSFPFQPRDFGQTVIVPQYEDMRRDPTSEDKNSATPQAYYMHNVLPIEVGYQSVRYVKMCSNPAPANAGFIDVLEIYNAASTINPLTRAYVGVSALSAGLTSTNPVRYLFSNTPTQMAAENWNDYGYVGSRGSTIPGVNGFQYTAYVNGRNFAAPCTVGAVWEINFNVQTFSTVSTNISVVFNGVCAAAGYLIGWSGEDANIYWSSTSNPADFAPSQITGAGGGAVQEAKGRVICCVPTLGGFYICTNNNIVYAAYTGNARYPFTFKEVRGAGGINNQYYIASDSNSPIAFALTGAGLQQLEGANCETIVPDLQSLIQSSKFQYWDTLTRTFVTKNVFTNAVYFRLAVVAKRYLAISYGDTIQASTSNSINVITYNYALIYDTVLGRWGKLYIPHTKIYTQAYGLVATIGTLNGIVDYIGVLLADGTMCQVNMEVDPTFLTTTNAVQIVGSQVITAALILGKFQFQRDAMLKLTGVSVENASGTNFSVSDIYSLDGKNITGVRTGYQMDATGNFRDYNFCISASNHSILIEGEFQVNSVQLNYTPDGDRIGSYAGV